MVHWLNNKDLSFTSSMDFFMMQLRKFSEQHLDQTTEEHLDAEGSPMKFDFGMIHIQLPTMISKAKVILSGEKIVSFSS